jgi:hypothetical protein
MVRDVRDDLQAKIRNETFYAEILNDLRKDLRTTTSYPAHRRLSPREQAVSLLIFARALTLVTKRGVQESPANLSLIREFTDACVAGGPNSSFYDVVVEAAACVAPDESVHLAAQLGRNDTDLQRKWQRWQPAQAALKCVYLAVMSLDPTGTGRQRWSNRWKAALNAFEVTFDGRLSAGKK